MPSRSPSKRPPLRLTYSLRMLSTRVALRRDRPITEVGGVIVPCNGEEERNTATVIAVGPRADFAVGDRVVVSRWAGEQLADETCVRLDEERGVVWVLDASSVCMRNGKAVAGHVVVRVDAKASLFDKREGGGIIQVAGFIGLGDESKMHAEQPTRGLVLDAGAGCDCKAGDRVHFGKYNGALLESATCEALGVARDAEVRVLREFDNHEITGPRGKRHVVIADEVHGIEEPEAAQ